MDGDRMLGVRAPAARADEVSTAFARLVAKYGASPRLLRQLDEVTDDRPEPRAAGGSAQPPRGLTRGLPARIGLAAAVATMAVVLQLVLVVVDPSRLTAVLIALAGGVVIFVVARVLLLTGSPGWVDAVAGDLPSGALTSAPDPAAVRIDVDPARFEPPPAEPTLGSLWAAIARRTVVRVDHHELGVRTLEPWTVVAWRARWHVVGWDRESQASRILPLSDLGDWVDAVEESGTFTVPYGIDVLIRELTAPQPSSEAIVHAVFLEATGAFDLQISDLLRAAGAGDLEAAQALLDLLSKQGGRRQPRAGWYPDPLGERNTIRLWNGTRWTATTRKRLAPIAPDTGQVQR